MRMLWVLLHLLLMYQQPPICLGRKYFDARLRMELASNRWFSTICSIETSCSAEDEIKPLSPREQKLRKQTADKVAAYKRHRSQKKEKKLSKNLETTQEKQEKLAKELEKNQEKQEIIEASQTSTEPRTSSPEKDGMTTLRECGRDARWKVLKKESFLFTILFSKVNLYSFLYLKLFICDVP